MRTALTLTLLFSILTVTHASPLQQSTMARIETEILAPEVSAVQLRYHLSDLQPSIIGQGEASFTTFPVEGEGTTMEPNRPQLPAVSRFVVVSPDKNIELVIEAEDPRRIPAEPRPFLSNIEGLTKAGEPSDTTGLYPLFPAEMSEPFIIRGVRLVKITVYPVQYDYATGEFLLRSQIDTEVREIGGLAENPVIQPIRRGRSREFLTMMSNFAVNGDQVGRDDPDRDSEPPYVGHYLVATNSEALRFLIPFIEFRRKAGYKMDIITFANGGAANDPGTILNGIRTRYNAYIDAGQDPFDYLLQVGDRSGYESEPGVGWRLESPAGVSTWGGAGHADYMFALLEGGQNDDYPDVAFGKWPGGSQATLELMVGRTLACEATPHMDNPAWFTRGAVYTQHWGNQNTSAWHISQPSNVRWGEEVLQRHGWEDIRFHENFEWDQYGNRWWGPFLTDQLNAPVSVMIGRAETYYFHNRNGAGRVDFNQRVNRNFAFPICINTSGHGEWGAESMYRQGDGNNLKGFLTYSNGWGNPMTSAETAIWADCVNGVFNQKLSVGWGWLYAMNHFEKYFPNNHQWAGRPIGPLHRTDNNLFADPAVRPWFAVPRMVEMESPASIAPETRMIEVFVHLPDSQDPVAGATVTFYAPGDIPLGNAANYANYDDIFARNTKTDENGIARLILPEGTSFEDQTTLFITVTGRDIRPFFADVDIEDQEAFVEVEEITLEEAGGNGDEFLNPGEQFNVILSAQNLGGEVAAGITARILSLSPYIEIEENNIIEFGDVAAGEAADGNRPVTLAISPFCPDAAARPILTPSLVVEFTSGESLWRSAFDLDVLAPHLEFRSVVDGDVIPDSATTIDVEIANVGRVASQELNVELFGSGQGVMVIEGGSSLPSIAPNRTARLSGPDFEISGNQVVVPGSRFKLFLVMSSGDGFVDTSYFSLQVMRPRAGAPIGPDKYGYVCFDDTDSLWDVAPEFEWEEINPDDDDAEFDGVRLEALEGQSPFDIGKSVVLPLGFTTTFYGVDFDSITVCTNGFIAMGNQFRITNHQNWPMDAAIAGGMGMLAPFWDDLRYGQESGIYAFHDEEDSRFIVEWYRMRPANGNAVQTFQVIIYDSGVWITESGDPNILFQYNTISNIENTRQVNDPPEQPWINATPFASVGISSPFGNTGINYTFANAYPMGAAALANRRAILFSTSVRFRAGILYGMVTDEATGEGIAGATVFTKHGFVAITDETGYWRIAEALADIPFDITARKQGYNDSSYVGQEDMVVPEHDSLQINFSLLHPEFSPTTFELSHSLDPGYTVDLGFTLLNSGNGPLDWTAEKRLLGDANANPWELRRRYNVGANLEDDRIEGVVFAEDKFFVSGANISANLEDNTIYILSREGELLDTFVQISSTRWGYKDLDWDGEFIWAPGDRVILGLTTNGEEAIRFDDPNSPTEKIACDRENGILYLSGTTTSIKRVDRAGNVLGEPFDRKELRIYGLAYWPEDPEGYNLYIVNSPGAGIFRVHKMNTETGDTLGVFQFANEETGQQQSAWITNEFDVYSWVMMSIQSLSRDRGGDRIEIHQLDARKDWMDLDDWDGRLETGESQDFTLTLNSTGLPDTLFQGEMLFYHNADSGRAHIMISLDVLGEEPPDPFSLVSPADGDTVTALPQHGDSVNVPEVSFNWNRSDDPNIDDSVVTYVQWFAVGEQTLGYSVADTFSVINTDTLNLPIGFDQPLMWWVNAVSDGDTTESIQRHRLMLVPNDLDAKDQLPVEFGLQSIYPSPFNGRTTIRFGADLAERTSLVAYDLTGREAARLFDAVPRIGYHTVTWNAAALPSGVYVIRLESAGRTNVQKIALLK